MFCCWSVYFTCCPIKKACICYTWQKLTQPLKMSQLVCSKYWHNHSKMSQWVCCKYWHNYSKLSQLVCAANIDTTIQRWAKWCAAFPFTVQSKGEEEAWKWNCNREILDPLPCQKGLYWEEELCILLGCSFKIYLWWSFRPHSHWGGFQALQRLKTASLSFQCLFFLHWGRAFVGRSER